MFNFLVFLMLGSSTSAFLVPSPPSSTTTQRTCLQPLNAISRRNLLGATIASTSSVASVLLSSSPFPAIAAEEEGTVARTVVVVVPDLDTYLYKVMRVREATEQERRLIATGKFKERARQNVKLAIRFMIQNYQLSDSMVAASAYLNGNTVQIKANDVGQAAVQNLQTILEYFDSSDVENLKVRARNVCNYRVTGWTMSPTGLGTRCIPGLEGPHHIISVSSPRLQVDSLAGKENLVIKGLESAQARIDDFLSYFPEDTVAGIRTKIQKENDLNEKEFDKSLGSIINLPTRS